MVRLSFALLLLPSLCSTKTLHAQEPVDRLAIERIRTEAQRHTRVMDYAYVLTETHGPRFTGTPSFLAAGEWAMETLVEMGLREVHAEPIDWGRGWAASHVSLHLVEPQATPLIAVAVPWSPATDGSLEAEALLVPLPEWENAAAYEAFFGTWRGKLTGRIVLAMDSISQSVQAHDELLPRRVTDEQLRAIIRRQETRLREQAAAADQADDGGDAPCADDSAPADADEIFSSAQFFAYQDSLHRFLREEGVAAILYGSAHRGGTVHLNGPMRLQPAWLRHDERVLPPPSVVVASEHYNRLLRLHLLGLPVRVRLELQTEFYRDPLSAFNVVAELPGSDKADELVMMGAHLDSWGLASGATDNAAGAAVVLEAMRILTALDLKPRRTIRLALWGGHEGEGLGSRSHVQRHFDAGYPQTWLEEDEQGKRHEPRPAFDHLSVYFNLDYLAGRIRGVFLQENEGARPIFEAWLAPFRADGADHLSGILAGGSDHMAFEDVGLPAFPFIQDGPDHPVHTHHSNMDVYDYLNEDDLKQSAMILASVAYHAAMREERIPRK